MNEVMSVSAPVPGTDVVMSFETGKLALQADGAVVARLGDTMVLATATASKAPREGADFFPLTIDVEERMYAAGKIPGSFFRREGRATEQAILNARLIDRPLRPCFPDGFRNDVHVVTTILGVDLINPHDVLAINAASAALMISGIPFDGPVGAVRIAWSKQGIWMAHPSYSDGDESCFELVVAGRALSENEESDVAIMMVEAGGTEASFENYAAGTPKVTEEVIADGLEVAKKWIMESIRLQRELVVRATARDTAGDHIKTYELFSDCPDDIKAVVENRVSGRMKEVLSIMDKAGREAALTTLTDETVNALQDEFPDQEAAIRSAVRSTMKKVLRKRVIEEGIRADGRGIEEVRPLYIEVGLIPTAHGSALFQRGETQVLNVTTLGMPRMNQLLDSIGIDETKRYMHHYNMPPYSTGEAGFMRGPKRREIGHGLLAERALVPVIPRESEFPYTLRLVSEAVSSNGSTSMASVCGSTLSLMDAGVPVREAVAGVAMGLIHDDGSYVTLTDILGMEDALGDMDFKVAGTRDSITALQLDTKIDGIPAEVLAQALQQAKRARLHILDAMLQVIDKPRATVSSNAPKIVAFEIPQDKIGEVIGPKGKVINTLQAETGADIAIDEEGGVGTVTIGAKEGSAVEEARRRIMLILDPPKPEVGAAYPGTVVGVTKFGAFINILPGRDGLLHISKVGRGARVERVEDVLNVGDRIDVVVDSVDADGKVSLLYADEPASGGGSTDASGRRAGSEMIATSANSDGLASAGGENHGDEGATAKSDDNAANLEIVSFDDEFDLEIAGEVGDLGPTSRDTPGDHSRSRRDPRGRRNHNRR
ncbi:MAG: polyribonucleotide nucleotidyltransferase [Actinobacteria bacterium]|nr:polyribonucleotide nucleotidyltransferase [Actinomycetota bacterium]MCL5447484.1 polyribonucleotide nucleotidyltransferase [Actinomycetota bacterium]